MQSFFFSFHFSVNKLQDEEKNKPVGELCKILLSFTN